MELCLESFWLRLKIWLWKGEREEDEMSRGNRMIGTYFTTQGIHQEIEVTNSPLEGIHPRD